MSLLKDYEVENIRQTYREVNSIEKTSELTGHSKNTVCRYVKEWSSKKKQSKDCPNLIEQYNLKTNKCIKIWFKPNHAAKELDISPSEIIRVLKGELKQAGGFGWRYKKEKK